MQYDFVLREVDPWIGPHLVALAEILNGVQGVTTEGSRLAAAQTVAKRLAVCLVIPANGEEVTKMSYTRIVEGALRLSAVIEQHQDLRGNAALMEEMKDIFIREACIDMLDDLAREADDQTLDREDYLPALIWLLNRVQPQWGAWASAKAEPNLLPLLASLKQCLADLLALTHVWISDEPNQLETK